MLAQSVFTNTYGGVHAEDGAGVIALGTVYKVGARTYDPSDHVYRAQLWNFAVDGTLQTQIPLPVDGSAFVQHCDPGNSVNTLMAGSVIPTDSSDHDALLIKLSSSDAFFWASAPPKAGDQQLFDAVGMPDGGAIACGVDNSEGNNEALVVRFDGAGQVMWWDTLGGPLDEEASAIAVSGSDVMITGRQMNFGGTTDCFFARLDLNGNVSWTSSWGGPENDAGHDIVMTSAGKFVMAGVTESFGTYDESSERYLPHVYLIKIDLLGDTLWTAAYGDTLSDHRGLAIDIASNGDLLVAGERDVNNAADAMVARIDASSNLLWKKEYDVDGWDRLLDITALSDGFIATGWSFGPESRQVLLIRRDQNGD